ncbi:hypothetical protein BT69DRAFT_698951 [Atractiella rhizophila]|nr:hypothetical protein BT69DRAFT_698951 [Atractiella rhizophila]
MVEFMEIEQIAGYYLLQDKSSLLQLLSTLEASPTPTLFSIFSNLFDSYSPSKNPAGEDIENSPQRSEVVSLLSDDFHLSKLLPYLQHEDRKLAGACASLFAQLVSGEDGSESWGYDEHDPDSILPPCPTKQKLLDSSPTFLSSALQLLRHEDSRAGGLSLLCRLAWGFKNGQEALRHAFSVLLEKGEHDVYFWESLYGEYEGHHAGRQKRRVAQAAVDAGAVDIVFKLLRSQLEKEDDLKADKAILEGVRCLLAADGVDTEVGRKSPDIATMICRIVRTRELEALKVCMYMFRLLEVEEENGGQAWILSWAEHGIGDEGMVRDLVFMLELHPYDWDKEKKEYPPEPEVWKDDPSGESQAYKEASEAFLKKAEAWDTRAEEERNLCQSHADTVVEILRLILPAIQTAQPLLSPLLKLSLQLSDSSSVLKVLVSLVNHVSSDLSTTVSSLLPLLTSHTSAFDTIASASPQLALGLCQGGAARLLLDILSASDELDVSTLSSFGVLLAKCPEEALRTSLRSDFFKEDRTVSQAAKAVKGEDIWDASRVAEALFDLAKGSEEAIACLANESKGLLDALFVLFRNEDAPVTSFVPLLGILACHTASGRDKLQKRLEEAFVSVSQRNKKKKSLSLLQLLERTRVLALVSSSTRKVLLEGGTVQLAIKGLEGKDAYAWKESARFLKAMGQYANEEGFIAALVPSFEIVASRLVNKNAPLDDLAQFISTVPQSFAAKLKASNVLNALLQGAMTDFSSHYNDVMTLFPIIARFCDDGEEGEGFAAVAEGVKKYLDEEDSATDERKPYDYTWGARRITEQGGNGARTMVAAGAVEYAIKLLKSENLDFVLRAARLLAVLIVKLPSTSESIRVLSVQGGAVTRLKEVIDGGKVDEETSKVLNEVKMVVEGQTEDFVCD